MNQQSPNTPYESARDLPSFLELTEQIGGMKLFTLAVRCQVRAEIMDIERQLDELSDSVDHFYKRLGDRNWIFHDNLNVKQIRAALDSNLTPEALEQHLVSMYQEPRTLEFMTRHFTSIPELSVRLELIERALSDYRAERYYATTLVLLTVMDGFVNDVETKRTGLHARSPEDLVA